MLTVAKEVFGVRKSMPNRKPFLNHAVLNVKKAIRTLRQLLRQYKR